MPPRQTFQEIMEMVELLPPAAPAGTLSSSSPSRFMSRRAAWVPGRDLALIGAEDQTGDGMPLPHMPQAAFGAHVYTQSALAACRVKDSIRKQAAGSKTQSLHTIHGTFTLAGRADRPFIYSVRPLSNAKSFSTMLVEAVQPSVPSTSPAKDRFPLADAELPPGPTCFQALVSFKTSEPTQRHEQEPSAQSRFEEILASREPIDWPPSPTVDVDGILKAAPEVAKIVGSFPALEMRKVDMTTYNESRPFHERRELILYRLLAPLPADASPDEHALVHVYECDRNGLLMLANHLGFGDRLGGVASLSWTYVIHGNIEESQIEYGENQWWVQEACWPRAGSGRGVIMSKIWSPAGLHVATEYQDGVVRRWDRPEKL